MLREKKEMKIGIFGGSFNPPHKVHLAICRQLIKSRKVDKIIFVPTGDKYDKDGLISAKHRLNMLNLAIFNENNAFYASNYEMRGKERVFTYQTLRHFKKAFPNDKIVFICGADNFKQLQSWKNYKEILHNYKIIVVKRNGEDVNNQINALSKFGLQCEVADFDECDLSSTKIRNILKNNKKSTLKSRFLDENVLKYIESNNIYER